MADPENIPTTTPLIIPAIHPEKTGASDAKAIPKHKGTATKKTTRPAGKSCFQVFEKKFILKSICYYLIDANKCFRGDNQ